MTRLILVLLLLPLAALAQSFPSPKIPPRPLVQAPRPLALDLSPLKGTTVLPEFDRDGDGYLSPADISSRLMSERQAQFEVRRAEALGEIVVRRLAKVLERFPEFDVAAIVAQLTLSAWSLEDVGPTLDSLAPVLLQSELREKDALATAAGWIAVWALKVGDEAAVRRGQPSLLQADGIDFGEEILRLLSNGSLRFKVSDEGLEARSAVMAYDPIEDTVIVPDGWVSAAPTLAVYGHRPQVTLLHELWHVLQDQRGKDLRLVAGEVEAHLFDTRIESMAFGLEPLVEGAVQMIDGSARLARLRPPPPGNLGSEVQWVVNKALKDWGLEFNLLSLLALEPGPESPDEYWLEHAYAAARTRGLLSSSLVRAMELRRLVADPAADPDLVERLARLDKLLPSRPRLTRSEEAALYEDKSLGSDRFIRQLEVVAHRTARVWAEDGPQAAARWLRRDLRPSERELLIAVLSAVTVRGDGVGP